MRKRGASLFLALALALTVLPIGARAGEFNEKHSTEKSGTISQAGEEDVYTFTVPCDGKVFVSGRARHKKYESINYTQYKIKI